MGRLRRLIALGISIALLMGVACAEEQITLTFVGDCTLGCEGRLWEKENSFATMVQSKGYAYFLQRVAPLLAGDDLTVANFEGVLKENAKGEANKTYCFRGLPGYAQILPLGSIEAVSLANNHAEDYGKAGITNTREALRSAGVEVFDSENAYLFRKNGVTIAFCGFWRASYYKKKDGYFDLIRQLKAEGANAVVCYLHFGREYSFQHSKDQEQMAHAMIDAGADLVIGSHPHVVQGLEVYQNRNIVYSLGNFVFGGNAAVRAQESLIARITLRFGEQGEYEGQQLRLYPVHNSGSAEQADYQPRLVQGGDAEAVYAIVDADSEGQPLPETQTETYRDYPYIPKNQQK